MHYLIQFIQIQDVSTIILILQIRKLSLRGVKTLTLKNNEDR